MARAIFTALIGLVAGFCLGLVCCFFFLSDDSVPAVAQSAMVSLPTPPAVTASDESLPPTTVTSTPAPTPSPALDTTDNTLLLFRCAQVLHALEQRDYQALSSLVHPTRGVLFTPYSTVDPAANLTFTAAQVAAFGKDSQKYVWGMTDGSGEPLEMTVNDYFSRYVYNADFAHAPMLGIDKVIGSGNSLENVSEAFPEERFVEYYFPGIDPQLNGFDWCGLKLVFAAHEQAYYLVAVIHSEWTV